MRALIYLRISDDRTGEAAGVGRQEQDCRAFCASHGFEVIEPPLVDNDISASRYSRKKRPGYRRLLELVEAGEAQAVVAWHIDRLYRQPKELEELIDLAEQTGVVIHTLHGKLDLTDGDGRAMARISVTIAAQASDAASRRIRRKHQELAEQGKPAGAVPPYGYRADWTIDPDAAARLRAAATRVIGGGSVRAICTEWNAQGVAGPKGGQWHPTQLRRILQNPRIAGLRTWNGTVVRKAVWPEIITPEESTALRAVFGTRPGVATAHKYLLGSGLATCAFCGHALQSRPNSKGKRAYACIKGAGYGGCGRIHRVAEPIEQFVLVRVLLALENTEPPAADPETQRLEGLIQASSARLAEAAQAYADEVLDLAAYKAARAAVEKRTAELQVGLAKRLQVAAPAPDPGTVVIVKDARTGETLREQPLQDGPWTAWWRQAAFDEQRARLRQVVASVEIGSAGRGHRADLAGFLDVPAVTVHWNEPWASWWASDRGQLLLKMLRSPVRRGAQRPSAAR